VVVPPFQRPYVWNQESQWEPLWKDVVRVAERLLASSAGSSSPTFLGAVVLQQMPGPVGTLQARRVIDGQQRLTTLQLLLDALHAELLGVGAEQPAMRLEALITNTAAFSSRPEDRFKVWPTNRDRPAFNWVMGAEPSIAYDELEHRSARLVESLRFFAQSEPGAEDDETRGSRWGHRGRGPDPLRR
jgi:hypothetical protein